MREQGQQGITTACSMCTGKLHGLVGQQGMEVELKMHAWGMLLTAHT